MSQLHNSLLTSNTHLSTARDKKLHQFFLSCIWQKESFVSVSGVFFFSHRFVLVGLSQIQIPVWTQQTVPTQIFYWPCAICAVSAITNQWSSQCQWERFQLWRFSLHYTLVVNLNMLDGNFCDQIIFMIDSFLFLRLKMFKKLVVYVVYWKILHISHNLYCNSWETLWTKCISYSIHFSNMKLLYILLHSLPAKYYELHCTSLV